ncbi:hypothetical protein H5410_061507 [Solanum commersonii]|uniref:Uncharacterized protein n=1 Tax=Solanum commersonii TaxID=4109 RepID=A0A9J5W816_SOLCO|nr:hypothetical protein H5410_061507 [Solanum commersonii]
MFHRSATVASCCKESTNISWKLWFRGRWPDQYIAKTLYGEEDEDITFEDTKRNVEMPKLLGVHPSSNEKILMKNGPYGYYVQLGEDKKGYVPKRASLSQVKDVNSVTLEDVLELLCYPVTLVWKSPDDGQLVILKLAKFGFTIRHRRTIAPVPKGISGTFGAFMYSRFQEGLDLANEKFPLKIEKTCGVSACLRIDELVDGPNAPHITPEALDRCEASLEDIFNGRLFHLLDATLSESCF